MYLRQANPFNQKWEDVNQQRQIPLSKFSKDIKKYHKQSCCSLKLIYMYALNEGQLMHQLLQLVPVVPVTSSEKEVHLTPKYFFRLKISLHLLEIH